MTKCVARANDSLLLSCQIELKHSLTNINLFVKSFFLYSLSGSVFISKGGSILISVEAVWPMNRIDEIFTESPFYGSRKIRDP